MLALGFLRPTMQVFNMNQKLNKLQFAQKPLPWFWKEMLICWVLFPKMTLSLRNLLLCTLCSSWQWEVICGDLWSYPPFGVCLSSLIWFLRYFCIQSLQFGHSISCDLCFKSRYWTNAKGKIFLIIWEGCLFFLFTFPPKNTSICLIRGACLPMSEAVAIFL